MTKPVIEARDEQLHVVRRSARGVVVLRYRAAEHDPGAARQPVEGRLERRAADIVEEDVDAVGRVHFQLCAQVRGPVVDGCVESGPLLEPATFLLTAGDADGSAALDLGDLSDEVAHRSGCPGHQHGLTGFRAADVE
jgi:hypothetical protein